MKVTIVQPDLVWEDPEANIKHIEELVAAHIDKSDLIVLPEMFSTGFSMNSAKLAEEMNGRSINWMKTLSASYNCSIAGSLIVKDKGKILNRLIFSSPDGEVTTYDKRHLFRMEKENLSFTRGNSRVVVAYKGFRINLQICYDLRFPVWSRTINQDYDVLLYIASWPEARREVWNSLLVARAIENQCYLIGVNRVGKDGEGISYCGDSVILGPKGEVIANTEMYKECAVTADLDLEDLNKFRKKFPVWQDADSFRLDY